MSVRQTNRFWSVSHELTLSLDFLKHFVKMRFTVTFVEKKAYFLDVWIKSYGCLKFLGKVWAGRACAGANEKELTKYKKNWGQEGREKGARVYKNGGPVGARSATAGQLRPPGW
jgi:hypothetical protein